MKITTIIGGILLLLLGLFYLMNPTLTFLSTGWFWGVALLAVGITLTIDQLSRQKGQGKNAFDFMLGVLTIIAGSLFLLNRELRLFADVIALFFIGGWIVLSGGLRIMEAMRVRKIPGSGWGWRLNFGILMCLFGFWALLQPHVAILSATWLIALIVIMAGCNLLLFASTLYKETDADGKTRWVKRSRIQ